MLTILEDFCQILELLTRKTFITKLYISESTFKNIFVKFTQKIKQIFVLKLKDNLFGFKQFFFIHKIIFKIKYFTK